MAGKPGEQWGAENRAGTGTAPADEPPATKVSDLVIAGTDT